MELKDSFIRTLFFTSLISLVGAQILCSAGQFSVTSLNATIPDPTYVGTSNYYDNFNCLWIIQPSSPTVTNITFIFNFLDVEYNFDYVNIFNGSGTNGALLGAYTGYAVPDILSVPGSVVTIQFISDESVDFTGFQLNYYSSFVTNCVHGYGIANSCVCFPGWEGFNCDIPTCTNNCSGQGSCINNTCVCYPGWFGGDCSKRNATYCTNETVLSGASGTFYDHLPNDDYFAQPYKPNTICSWIINSTPGSKLTLVLVRHQTQYPNDEIRIYDANNNLVIVWTTDGYPLDPVIVPTSSARVVFTSDGSIQYSGFEMAWYSHSLCLNDCSQQGWCIENECRCYPGYDGTYCELHQQAVALSPGATFQSFVLNYQTNLFVVNVTSKISSFTFGFSRTLLSIPPYTHWGGGFPQFGISESQIPSRNLSDTIDNYWFSYFDDAVIVEFPPIAVYYIAVFGLEESGYTITLGSFVPSPSTDTSSPQNLVENPTNNVGLAIGIVILVLIIAALIAVIAIGVWRRRKASRNFRTMTDEDEGHSSNL